MRFTIWKVKYGLEEGLFTYSLRQGVNDYPTVLDQDKFNRLFPEIDTDHIPAAPGTIEMEISPCLIPST